MAQGANNKGEHNTTIGTDTDTLRNVTEGDTTKNGQPMDTDANTRLVDGEGTAHKLDTSTESGGSTAVGYNNKAEGDNSTAIGNTAKIINKPVTYYADKDGNKTTSTDDAAWYKDSSGNPTQVPQVFRDADGNTTTTPQYVHTYTVTDPDTGAETTKTEITSDATKADQKDGKPVYNYQKSDNLDKLYSVTLYQAASNSIAAGTDVTANGNNAVAVGYNSTADNSAVAVGDTAVASENAVAIGKNTNASVEGSIALGNGSKADRSGGTTGWDPKTGTTSINSGLAWTSTEGALSVGSGTVSRQITGVAAGSEDTDAVNLAQLKKAMTHYYSVKTTAETDGKGNNNYLNDGATGDNALAAGVSAVAQGNNATAVGTSANATASQATAIGNSASATSSQSTAIGNSAGAHGDYATALGNSANASSTYATAIGAGTIAPYSQSTAVGASANATATQATAMGSSASATSSQSTAVGYNAGAHGESATALGNGASATNKQATAIGSGAAASGADAIAMGNGSSSTDSSTIAIGSGAGAHGDYATALGSGASATSYEATAIGSGAAANGSYAIAMGNGSSSTDSSTIAIGSGAGAHSSSAIALGSGASANSSYVIAIGNGASAQNGDYGIAIGSSASTQYEEGTALGHNAKTTAPNGTALGSGASANYHALALGNNATASQSYALAAGDGASAQDYYAIALGSNAGATEENAVVLGKNAKSNVNGGIALGSDSTAYRASGTTGLDPRTGKAYTDTSDKTWNSTYGALSIGNVDSDGNVTGTRQIIGVAAGTNDTDAVNMAQLKQVAQGFSIHDYGVNSIDTTTDTNYNNAGAVGNNSLAAGVSAKAIGDNAVAIGYKAKAEGVGATVIGQYGEATGRYALAFGGQQTDTTAEQANNVASGDNAVSFGERTTASGNNATAFGWQTTATQKRATAFGERTTASGANSTAFGQLAVASGQNSTAFGNEAVANNYGTTAFGNRTEALGAYSTAFGNSTVAAGMNTVAFGTDNVAGAVLDGNGAYTNIIYQTNPKNGRVVKDANGNPIELSREKMDARGNLAYTDSNGNTKSVTYTVSGGETHSYVLLQGEDGNTYIRDYRGNIRSASIGADGTVTVGDTVPTNVTLKKANAGANGYNILSNANATVWGENSIASGEASTAFGIDSTASGKNSLAALGGTASAENAAAIGNGAKATLADSVALGSGALANRASGSKGYDVLTGKASSNTSAAWVANANAIAIGNDTEGSLLTRQITGVAAGSLDTDAVNVAQLKAAGLSFTTNTKDASNTTDNYKGYKVVSRKLGDTIAIKAGDEADNHSYSTSNLTTRIAENGDISILMDENPTFTSVTTGDVIFAGNPDLTDKDGKAAKADTNAAYGTKTLTDSQNITSAGNDTQATRLHYKDDQGHTYEVATMDDGQIYAGDIKTDGTPDSTGFARTMNQKTTINGGVTNKDSLTDNNIGVVSNGTDTLTVKLAKDLKDLNSVTTGKTVQNGSGIKITNDAADETKNVVINGDQISFGGNQVNNMGSGINSTTNQYDTPSNGANIGDVKNIANSTVQPVIDTVNKGWELDVNGTKQKAVTPDSPKVNLIQGQNITITGDTTNTDNVTVATADDVRFNTVRVGGSKTDTGYTGGILIGTQSGKNADGTESANSNDDYYITGLKNTNWDSTKIQHGRAATEDQLQAVATEIKNGTVKGDVYVTGGAVSYKGEGEGADPKAKDGTGSINLTRQNGTDVQINGLHDYYVTGGTVTDDGKKLELTRNDVDKDGNHQKISIDLSNALKHDLHLVQNPVAGSKGQYTVDTKTGTVTLKVQNADGSDTSDITIGGFEGLGQGLKFGANKMAVDGGGNPVTNQLGSIINITGAGAKALNQYSGKNLITSVEQDADGNTTIHVLMDKNISADGVTVGQAGRDGVAGADGEIGQAGTIGINGKNGVKGEDGKEGITTTIIRTEKGQPGADGTNGKPGVDGTDITRIVYQNGQDGTDGKDTHTVATLDDGLKFAGDDGQNDDTKVINKKLNERLDIVGKAQGDLTDANIGVTKDENGKLYIRLAKHVNLDGDGTLQAGDAKIGHFSNTELTTNKGNHPADGSYTIGLGNTDWNVDSPDYVSGRAATEDQLAKVSEAITNATTAAGKRTVVTVNDKSNPAIADPGTNTYGEYASNNGNLMVAAERDNDGLMTYNIKLNDNLAIGQKGENGKDGKVTVDTKGGTTVVIGHDGNDGENGKDGISVKGKDGKDGVTISVSNGKDGKDGSEGHIGLTGPAGKDGKDASADIHVKNGQNGVDGTDGNNGKDGMDRVVYEDHNGKSHEVATMDDGLKFAGDDVNTTVAKKLNETLQIRGDGTYDEKNNTVANDGNIKTSVDNGAVKVSLSDTINLHQDGSLTVGGSRNGNVADGNDPIVIKNFGAGDLTVTGKDKDGNTPQSKAGDYVTGLDNKKWNVENPTYVSGRAATEDQLKTISDAVNKAASTAGMHTVVTVNDKDSSETTASVGTDGKYGAYSDSTQGNLLIAAKDENGKTTYNIKLNDQLAIGQKGEKGEQGQPGTPGKDGKVTVETKGGTTVVIGHDGKDGDNGKDGLFVTGKDGKDGKSGVSITGPNGADGVDGKVGIAGKDGKDAVSIAGKDGVGHIGLTGPKGEKGADGTPGRDGTSIDISTDYGTKTLDSNKNVTVDNKEQASRIIYNDAKGPHEVATMDDGLKFVGNDGEEVTKKLNSTLSITGGMDKNAVTKASSKNLGVRSNKDDDGLEIVMTDTPDFTKVTVGEGTDPNSKITIGKQTVTGKKSDGTDGTSETGKYITGLDNTKWNKDNVVENRAATEGQLRDIAGSITNQNQGGGFALTSDEKGADKIVKQDLGKAIQIKGDTAYKTDGTVEKAGNIKTSIDNGAIKVELNKDVDLTKDGSIKAGETTINKGGVDTNKVTIKDSTISISKDGINGGDKQITNVASGASEITKDADGKVSYKYDNETNAANIGDVKRIAGDMKTEINNNISNVTNKVDQIGQHVDNIQNDVKQLKTDVKADRTYQGDDGAAKKVNVKFGSFLSLTGGAKVADLTEEGNIGVVQKEIDDPDHKGEKIAGLSVRLAKHLNLEKTTYTSNENGQTYTSEIDGKGLTIKTGDENRNITVQDGNVNMGGNQIHNVAPGQAPGDAVNVGQLNATNQTVANLGGAVNKLGTRVNRVGAGAAALAALHPLDFDPDDKWDFAAGYGNYKDASAVAVGAYYRPNEDTMFSVGGSFGGGENMVNAGVSFKVGQGNHVSTSRVAMAKEIKDLRQDVANLNAIVNRQSALIDKLTGTNAGTIQDAGNDLFPDVPANHWAYEYVTKLKQAGILTGYPDGNFDGDRMMTRYEFAAIVYRAIMAGAASNPALSQDGTLDKLAKEFSPEMKHIRIDTIAKDKNGKPTIERVRVIPEVQQ